MMSLFTSLSENERTLLYNFIRFSDINGLTRVDAANIHTNTNEFGIRPITLEATFSKLCDKLVLIRTRDRDNDVYYYSLHPDWADEIDEFATAFKPKKKTEEEIPASDRFVGLDDNNPARREAVQSLADLSDAIKKSNVLFANADERLQVSREIDHIGELINAPSIHVVGVWESVKQNKTLRWLMEQSVSGIVRAAAEKAFEHLDKLLHLLLSQ